MKQQGMSRREFIKIGVAGAATTVLVGCQPHQRYEQLEPYVRPPEEVLPGEATWYATTDGMSPGGNGVIVRVMNGRALKIEGNPEHPLNRGKLDARGQAGLQLLYHPDRLTAPVEQNEGGSHEFRPLHWNDAVNALAEKLQAAGDAVAIWSGVNVSGHLVDLFGRYSEAVGATAPVYYDLDAAIHGCGPLMDAQLALFNERVLPAYDLAHADVIFAFNADFLGDGLSNIHYNHAYGAFRSQALGKRGFLAVFEPRMSITGAVADRWVPVKPGQEALLAGAIAKLIAEEGFGGEARAARAEALRAEVDVAAVAEACDTSVETLAMLARVFADAGKPLAIPGNPVAGTENGVEMVKAVQMLNVIAGAATMYPGVNAPVVAAGPSPFADVKALIDEMNAGAVKVLLVYGANPLYELPRALGFRDAIRKVEYVVSFAPVIDETAVQANLVLPERTYLEGWGYKVASPAMGRLVISSQQPVVKPFHETEATGPHYSAGDVMLTVARGIPEAAAAMPWADEVAYLKQVVAGLPAGAFGGNDEATRWSRYLQHGGWWDAGEVEAAAPPAEPAPVEIRAAAFPGDEGEYPFYLHVYTPVMLGAGSAAAVPWLQGAPDPMTTVSWQSWVEINPKTAEELGLQDGDVVKLTTPGGAEVEGPVYIYPAIRPDTIAVPVGQGHSEAGRYAKDRGFNAARLLGAEADATGAHLAWASQRVKLEATGERAELPLFEDKEGAHEPLHL